MFFDAIGAAWEYEPEGIVLSDESQYLPDFYLSDLHGYFEVKRKSIKGTAEEEKAIWKISNGQYTDTWAGIIAFGDPMDDDLYIFCQETDDGGGGCFDDPVTIGFHPETFKPYLFAYNDRRERSFMIAQGVGGQKATFPNAMYAGDDVALLASTRECTRNGGTETKYGFIQYSVAWDSKHIVSLPQGKSAQLLYSRQEMDDGGILLR